MSDFRKEYLTWTGEQTTNVGSDRFYLPLEPFIPFLHNLAVNASWRNSAGQNVQYLTKLKITIVFTSPVTTANDHAKICVSNTNANSYNSMVFDNVNYMRRYREVRDVNTIMSPPLSTVRFFIPKFETKTYTQAWNGSATSISFKLSDIGKRAYVQKLIVWVDPVETTFNAATAGGLRYSGFNYIKWSKQVLAYNNQTIDFINSADSNVRLRAFEIMQHQRQYGAALPSACYTGTDAFTNQYLLMTEILFDDLEIDAQTYDVVNTLNSAGLEDYAITLAPGSMANFTNATVYVSMVYYDRYMWDNQGKIIKMTQENQE
jgi:hypothetical protein